MLFVASVEEFTLAKNSQLTKRDVSINDGGFVLQFFAVM
jgi:hypothetical protein